MFTQLQVYTSWVYNVLCLKLCVSRRFRISNIYTPEYSIFSGGMARRKEIWITQYAYFVVAYTLASMILSRDRIPTVTSLWCSTCFSPFIRNRRSITSIERRVYQFPFEKGIVRRNQPQNRFWLFRYCRLEGIVEREWS